MKPANVAAVLQLVRGEASPLQGTKLKALYKLIQAKGQTVTTNDTESKLNGLKAIEIEPQTFVAISRRAVGPDFYPCSMQFHLMTEL